jgi:hypothetical protein
MQHQHRVAETGVDSEADLDQANEAVEGEEVAVAAAVVAVEDREVVKRAIRNGYRLRSSVASLRT